MPQIPWKPILGLLAAVVGAVVMLAVTLVLAAVAMAVLAVVAAVTVLGALLLAYPDLIVILEDGTPEGLWLSVGWWV